MTLTKIKDIVLIEPLWNWNEDYQLVQMMEIGLNRTFMELKRYIDWTPYPVS